MTINNELLNSAVNLIDDCEQVLRKISTSCCMPGRSPLMNTSFELMAKARAEIQQLDEQPSGFAFCCESLGEIGSQIGRLHVTCCTETRESMYQQILKQLNTAHENLNKAMGLSHS